MQEDSKAFFTALGIGPEDLGKREERRRFGSSEN